VLSLGRWLSPVCTLRWISRCRVCQSCQRLQSRRLPACRCERLLRFASAWINGFVCRQARGPDLAPCSDPFGSRPLLWQPLAQQLITGDAAAADPSGLGSSSHPAAEPAAERPRSVVLRRGARSKRSAKPASSAGNGSSSDRGGSVKPEQAGLSSGGGSSGAPGSFAQMIVWPDGKEAQISQEDMQRHTHAVRQGQVNRAVPLFPCCEASCLLRCLCMVDARVPTT
jgi:hypothetical protein